MTRETRFGALAADAELKKNAARVARRGEVMAAMGTAIAGRDRNELAEALRARDVPAGEVFTVKEALSDPHLQARGAVGTFTHPTEGEFRGLRTPIRFNGLDDPEMAPPPMLGDSTDIILRDRLKLSADAIAALKSEGAI